MSNVNHPAHYGGKDDPYEVIKVAEAWGFDKNAYLFNVLKYIRREKGHTLEDLEKARWYLDRLITRLGGRQLGNTATLEVTGPCSGKLIIDWEKRTFDFKRDPGGAGGGGDTERDTVISTSSVAYTGGHGGSGAGGSNAASVSNVQGGGGKVRYNHDHRADWPCQEGCPAWNQ